jgi:hypothetical protein
MPGGFPRFLPPVGHHLWRNRLRIGVGVRGFSAGRGGCGRWGTSMRGPVGPVGKSGRNTRRRRPSRPCGLAYRKKDDDRRRLVRIRVSEGAAHSWEESEKAGVNDHNQNECCRAHPNPTRNSYAEFPRALCHETAGLPARIASIHPATKNSKRPAGSRPSRAAEEENDAFQADRIATRPEYASRADSDCASRGEDS